MNSDLISRSELKKAIKDNGYSHYFEIFDIIDNAPTVEYSFYQEAYQTGYEEGKNEKPTINCKDCDGYEAGYSAGLKDAERPQGEWARHDEWRSGEYIGGFYHVNCPCEDGYYSKWETNFCPNCGLPMKKGGAE